MFTKYTRINEFDAITRFRLINAFLFGIGFNLIIPVLLDLRGEMLTSTFITFILIVTTLSVKSNQYFINHFTMSSLYKLGIFVHLFFLMGSTLYFYDKLLFVYVDSFLGILETAIFSAYRIKLDVHLAEKYPNKVSNFQVFRNSTFADATLIGLISVWFITFYGGNDSAITTFIGFNILFTSWMMYNFNYIDKHLN